MLFHTNLFRLLLGSLPLLSSCESISILSLVSNICSSHSLLLQHLSIRPFLKQHLKNLRATTNGWQKRRYECFWFCVCFGWFRVEYILLRKRILNNCLKNRGRHHDFFKKEKSDNNCLKNWERNHDFFFFEICEQKN